MEIEIHCIQDLNKLCRLCLNPASDMYSIYDLTPSDQTGQNIQFADMITECTSVIIDPNDGMPEAICIDCMNLLKSCYNFKELSGKSDKQLRELLKTLKDIKKENSYIIFKYERDEAVETIKQETITETTKTIYSDKDDFKSEDLEINEKELKNIDEDFNLDIKSEIEDDDEEDPNYEPLTDLQSTEKIKKVDTKEIFRCKFCSKSFSNKRNLGKHEVFCKSHEYSCDVCFKNFYEISQFHAHIKQHGGESNIKLFHCDICNQTFTSNQKLILHFQSHLTTAYYFDVDLCNDDFQCYICADKFVKYSDLISHLDKDHQIYLCRICDEKDFENETLFKTHLKSHGIKPYNCNRCLISFNFQTQFKKHVRIHKKNDTQKVFGCSLCENVYDERVKLKLHLKDHFNDLYKCTVCSSTFTTQPELHNHSKEHDNPEFNICPICGKLISKHHLKDHLASTHVDNSQIKFFRCQICPKTFKKRQFLINHERTHSDWKPFICNFCGYCSRTKSDLNTHIRTHTGEKPYVCKMAGCDRAFTTASQRMDHMRRHTDERRHKCQLCNKSFGVSHTLKIHMLMHLNIRPHNCEICGKKFRRKHHLVIHRRKLHEEQ